MVPRSMCKDDEEFRQMLRDDFAAKAMQAFLTASGINKAGVPGCNSFEYVVADNAYVLADAMLRARGQS